MKEQRERGRQRLREMEMRGFRNFWRRQLRAKLLEPLGYVKDISPRSPQAEGLTGNLVAVCDERHTLACSYPGAN